MTFWASVILAGGALWIGAVVLSLSTEQTWIVPVATPLVIGGVAAMHRARVCAQSPSRKNNLGARSAENPPRREQPRKVGV